MFILNGRFGNDLVGKPTSRNMSVVDYVICSGLFLSKLDNFDVLTFSKLYSDIHSALLITLKGDKPSVSNPDHTNTHIERIGKWKHEKAHEYIKNVNRNQEDELLCTISDIGDNCKTIDQGIIDGIVQNITDVLIDPAKKCI